MKKIKISIFLVLGSITALSQSNTFPESGKVGIGTTTNLTRILTVNGGVDIYGEGSSDAGLLLYHPVENGISSTRWFFRANYSDNGSYPYLTNRTPNGKVVIKTGSSTGGSENAHFTIEGGNGTVNSYFENTRLGIGTTTPSQSLDINGNLAMSGDILGAKFTLDLNVGSYQKRITSNQVGGSATMELQTYSDLSSTLQTRILMRGGGSNDIEFYDKSQSQFVHFDGDNGRVGIGVTNPDSKLVVDGKIRAEEVKVEIINGPDYVFESAYKLRTLRETKAYIAENKHLPEIPSAKEMEMNGIDLGDMNMRLLKKIEELTLYQIELMEKMEVQNEQLLGQQERIKLLEKKIKSDGQTEPITR